MDRFDLMLHPVRLRIALILAGRTMTPREVATQMPDVAQSTLYRHINTLIEAGVLTIVSETQVRGTVERQITLEKSAQGMDPAAFASLPPDKQATHFLSFISSLLHEFREALAHPIDQVPPAYYGKDRFYATASELAEIGEAFNALFSRYADPHRDTGDEPIYAWLSTGIITPDTFPNKDK